MAGQSNPYTPITFSAVLPLKNGIFTVNMPTPQPTRGVGIFRVKMSFFSGKTAENVMGVYGFDRPAIF